MLGLIPVSAIEMSKLLRRIRTMAPKIATTVS